METLLFPTVVQSAGISIDSSRTLEYFGVVNYATTERVIEEIRQLVQEDAAAPIFLVITSAGGPSGIALSFYDHIRSILKPNLVTIGSGDVDSSGIVLLMAGTTRYATHNTSFLLHPAGGQFEPARRYTAVEIDATLREYRLKDFQYASVLAQNSAGRISAEKVQELMEAHTILTPTDLLSYGLIHSVLP